MNFMLNQKTIYEAVGVQLLAVAKLKADFRTQCELLVIYTIQLNKIL